jgi:uncharacterized repeat protein (TIGR01451 family)
MTCAGPLTDAVLGQHQNTATATGQGVDNTGAPVGPPINATDTADYTATPRAAAIALVKDVQGQHQPAPPGVFVPVGNSVTFTYLVTNIGDTTLNPVSVSDDVLGAITCPVTSLAPAITTACTATTPAKAGQQTNHATATGQPVNSAGNPVGPPVTDTGTANYFGSAPALTLVKNINGQHEPTSPGLFVPVGDPLNFTYVVTNTGNVTLNPIGLTDIPSPGTITCQATSLAPGANTTCTATTTAAAGQQTNTATATGQGVDNTGTPVGPPAQSNQDTANYFGASAALTLVKDVNGLHAPNAPGPFVPTGSTVTFAYLVTNTGNVTLAPVTVTDSVLGAVTCPPTPVLPGDTLTCTATARAAAGEQTNNAGATGQGVDNTGTPVGPPAQSNQDTANYFGASPALTLVKDVNGEHEPTAPGLFDPVGAPVTFTYLVTNTGNVTLNPVSVTDIPSPGPITCPATSLAPQTSTTCTATARAAAGEQTNNAGATGQGVDNTGTPVGPPAQSNQDTAHYFGAMPSLTMTKSATPATVTKVGEVVTYTFHVTNTGNVTLTNATIKEGAFSGTGTAPTATCPPEAASLAPGASVDCTATYTVTQADLDAGTAITNTATATGTPPEGVVTPESPPSTATEPITQSPAMTLVKSANTTMFSGPGTVITYSYKVTNTGNVTLTGVKVIDPMPGLSAVTCPSTTLAPGASVTCAATYTTTQADVAHGSVKNVATASAVDPHDAPMLSDPSTAIVSGLPVAPPSPITPVPVPVTG